MEDLKIKSEVEEVISRRSFLRKAAYVAPAIVSLGALNAQAGTAIGSSVFKNNIVSYGNGEVIGTATVRGHNGVVDSGEAVNAVGGSFSPYHSSQYTAAEVNANTNPSYHFWSYFQQYFGTIN